MTALGLDRVRDGLLDDPLADALAALGRPAWMSYGMCRNADPGLFFPTRDTGHRTHQDITAARHICNACPVAQQCLQYALDTNQQHGIWGAMTVNERRQIRRQRHQSA